jgi:hypothetical protein
MQLIASILDYKKQNIIFGGFLDNNSSYMVVNVRDTAVVLQDSLGFSILAI